MKTIEQRINNISGQLEGIKKMLSDKERDCFSLIIQLKAIKSAMGSLMEKIIIEEFDHCLVDRKNTEKNKLEKIFKEIINN
ncbi:MAG: metal-sensitive transcriptional regulator [Patescibacteria group bacterium]|jgi:DNA-binding FrmR family transcriptional regulator